MSAQVTDVWLLAAAFGLDLLGGDPRWLPHPVRGFGWTGSRIEKAWRGAGNRIGLRAAGACFTLTAVAAGMGCVWTSLLLTSENTALVSAVTVYWIHSLIAARDLDVEARAVIVALQPLRGWKLLLFSLATVVAVAAPPQRIISAAPSTTEMLYALGLGDRVVGVTSFCHYPPEVRNKPKIGSYMKPNIETMLAMRPDLVVILKEHAGLGESIRKVGLTVLELENNNLESIFTSLRELGRRAEVEDTAEKRIAGIRAALSDIRARAEKLPRRSVMFIVGRTPEAIRDLVVVGRGSFLNELIAIAGGRNLFGDVAAFYPKIGLEELYAGRPEVIIDMGDMSDTDQVTEEHKRSVAALWQQYPMVPAVQAGRVYAVANDVFVVPGPRVAEAAAELLRMIHPEAAQ